MCYTGGLYNPCTFQFNGCCAQVVEQPDATAEQDRRQVGMTELRSE